MLDFRLPFVAASLASAVVVAAERPGALLERAEAALERGHPAAAESLLTEARKARPLESTRHRRELLEARLAASRGDWRGADARLLAWKNDPARGEGSGEVLFWMGWSVLHQGKRARADSLFVLASAYAGQADARRAQEALEYRFAALVEDSPALLDYLRGLPESPLPDSLRAAALARVGQGSRLRPEALWQLALLRELRGDTLEARRALAELASDLSTLPGRRAAARLQRGREASSPDSARRGYEAILLRQQQGVPSEFARKRLQELRPRP